MADPWMKFYPNDWMGEPKLKLVSRAARSLWMDMLCLMHQAGTGRLELKGQPMTQKELSTILGDNPRTIKKLMAELSDAGVSIVVEGSFVASSRMIEDFQKAERDKSNGRKGGNPALKTRENGGERVNPEVKAQKPEARSQKEVDKSTSSQEVEKYQEYLRAHPSPVDSDAGAALFSELVADGVDPDQIISAAKVYAATVKNWSSEGKVQQSDNFLDPDRGKWREQTQPKVVKRSSTQARLAFWAEKINGEGFVAPNAINANLARALIGAGLVTPEKLKQRGIAA